ncbi:hypothetical protein niasHS_003924 [Heterodera schachtii]|uniref:K Homology domain-containing protein n=1 Tax=Heterodera schachtii TaxID=97005 RepID=A0ABD2K3J8_HETSC
MTTEKKTLDYSVDFPQLPDAAAVMSTSSSSIGVWSSVSQPTIKSSVITEAFKLSAEERASRGFGKTFGTASEEQQKCNQIAKLTGTTIELNEAKDQSITILISGRERCVADARTRLVRELQTQATIKLDIPKDYHSYVIGKQGAKLRQLEQKFLCRIHMPGREEKSDTIRIVGPNEYIMEAAKHIQGIADEMAKQKTEILEIPRAFYPWIKGMNNEKVEDLMRRTGAKVNIPPPHANNETIIVTGERDGVDEAAVEILKIFNEKKESVVSVEVTVPKAQHRYVIGQKRAGLEEIFRETEVLVELPPEDSDSETVILRGPKDKIGDAAGAVYQKASSNIAIELPYKEWMRRLLIGAKGQNLHNLVPNHDQLKIDFEDSVIYIEGPTDLVKQAQQQLSAEIARLESEPRFEAMRNAPDDTRPGEEREPQSKIQFNVDPKHHRHFIIRGAEVLKNIQKDFECQISFPKQETGDSLVTVRGRKELVEGAKARIEAIVEDMEAQAQIQIDVDPKHHRHFIIRGAEVLKQIQKESECQISFPKQETGDSLVTIRGRKELVEGAKARIEAIVEDLEAQTQVQIDVDPKHHRHFIIRGAEVLKNIQKEFDCQISFPKQETGDSLVTIRGRKEFVEGAKTRIEAIVEDMEAQTQIQITVDPKYHRHFIMRGAEVLKQIQKEFKCQISFPKQETGDSLVTVRGRVDNVERAKSRIEEIIEELFDLYDESQYIVRRDDPPPPKAEPNDIEMVNAPWQIDSIEQFPGLSGDAVAAQQQKPVTATAVWGQRR